MAKDKRFFVFKQADEGPITGADIVFQVMFEGNVTAARELIGEGAFADGVYLVLEDTSGLITVIVRRRLRFPRPLLPRAYRTRPLLSSPFPCASGPAVAKPKKPRDRGKAYDPPSAA